MRVNGDEAHRPFAVESCRAARARGGGQAEAAGAQNIDGDEIAVARLALAAGGDDEFAAADVLLVDRHDAAAAARVRAKNAEHLRSWRARSSLTTRPL